MTLSSERRQDWLGDRESPSPWVIALIGIKKEACGGDSTWNALLKQQRHTDSSGHAERKWWTRLGDGHKYQNGTAAHGQVSKKVDDTWRSGSTGMGKCSRLHSRIRWEVWRIAIECSGSRSATNEWSWCFGTSNDNIWSGNGESWHCPRNIAKAA